MIINAQTGTNVREIADGIYRINTPVDLPDGQAFNFNQYLLVDDEPQLFRRDGAAPLLAFHLQVDAARVHGRAHAFAATHCARGRSVATIHPRLHRRTPHRAEGAEHAAVSGCWAQERLAPLALIEKQAGVGRHGLALGATTVRTRQHRLEFDALPLHGSAGERRNDEEVRVEQVQAHGDEGHATRHIEGTLPARERAYLLEPPHCARAKRDGHRASEREGQQHQGAPRQASRCPPSRRAVRSAPACTPGRSQWRTAPRAQTRPTSR
jgi:hypothetical protein